MNSRVALIGIIVEDMTMISKMNEILHEYSKYIIGRMGIPYSKKNISVISIAIDAPNDIINAISGKIGAMKGITTKTIYSNI